MGLCFLLVQRLPETILTCIISVHLRQFDNIGVTIHKAILVTFTSSLSVLIKVTLRTQFSFKIDLTESIICWTSKRNTTSVTLLFSSTCAIVLIASKHFAENKNCFLTYLIQTRYLVSSV